MTDLKFSHKPLKKLKMPPRRNRRNRGAEPEPVDPLADCLLPQRILNSILSRLPVKTLVRFERVCRTWANLAMDPAFVKLHYNCFSQLPKTTGYMAQVLSYLHLDVYPTKVFDPTKPEHLFMASCRGLICFARPLITNHIVLWNPASRLWKIIPHPAPNHRNDPKMMTVGFGCNRDGDDYTFVRIFCFRGEEMKVSVEIYSTKSDCWKKINAGLNFGTMYLGQQTVVNGNPHWAVYNTKREPVVLRFDATTKTFTQFGLPPSKGAGMLMFVDWAGYLGAFHCITKDGDWLEWIDIWLYVNEFGWIRKVTFGTRGGEIQVDRILDYNHEKGKIVGRSKSGGLFEFDTNKKQVKKFGEERGKRGAYKAFVHEESLVSVEGMRYLNVLGRFADNKRMESVIDGFFTCLIPNGGYTDLELYYSLAI